MTGPADPDVELGTVTERALAVAVAAVTGLAGTPARPGQVAMAGAVTEAMDHRGQVAVAAPTGVGKTLAYLVAAAVRAVRHGERTVVSTETLGLGAQIVERDGPTAAAAVAEVTGRRAPTVAVHKGWSNYVCSAAAASVVADLAAAAGTGLTPQTGPVGPDDLLDLVADAEAAAEAGTKARVGGTGPTPLAVATAAAWALRSVAVAAPSDRDAAAAVGIGPREWSDLSVSAGECPGTARCDHGSCCAPAAAHQRAAAADIVVTNHTMVGIQAARGVPVVISSARLGDFHHIVVDECHSLAPTVRDRGAVALSAPRLTSLRRAFVAAVDEPRGYDAAGALDALAEAVTARLEAVAVTEATATRVGGDGTETMTIPASAGLGDELVTSLRSWVRTARRLLAGVPDPDVAATVLAVGRCRGRLDALIDDLATAEAGGDEVARWIERSPAPGGGTSVALRMSPVDVAGRVRARLWTAEVETAHPDGSAGVATVPGRRATLRTASPDATGTISWDLSVIACSATPGATLADEIGFDSDARDMAVPSPFDDAYRASMCFAPRPTDADMEAMGRPGRRKGRFGLDTAAHPRWAAGLIAELIVANGGSALVLAATTRAGQFYASEVAERVRAAGCASPVHTQWDRASAAASVARWKAEPGATLIGTRGLMTGLDASGDACSLVIIDRIPRAAANPVDDARVAAARRVRRCGTWEATRHVYAADAALALAQAAGRLIRTTTDIGMVAVTDPRLVPGTPMAFDEDTRQLYLDGLRGFGTLTADRDRALRFLVDRRAGRTRRVPS